MRHIRILNNMASVGGSVISSDTLLFLFARTNPGSSLDGRNASVNKYSVSRKMPRSGAPRARQVYEFGVSLLRCLSLSGGELGAF